MSDKCPKCGARMVWFIDYERNDGSGLGLRCVQRCGGQITFADLRRQRDHAQAHCDALRINSETTIGQLRQQAKHLEDRVTELEAGIVSFLDCAMRDAATLLKEGDKAGWWDTNGLTPLCEIGDKLVDFGKWEIHPDGYGRRQFYRPIEVDARKETT